MAELLITGGRVIDPETNFDATADVRVVDGRVAEISTRPLDATPGAQSLDAERCLVTPGLIDLHVHFREPDPEHEETIATGSAAALAGGFTSVCCMPNTRPPLDTPAQMEFILETARQADGARVFPVACATVGRVGTEVAPIADLAQSGAIAISDDGDCVDSPAIMREVFRRTAAAGRCFMQHCQERTLTVGASMNAGPVADRLDQIGWPAMAEEMIIERDIRLDEDLGCRYHAQHVSSAGSVELIRAARRHGRPVSGEVSPHHLLLTDEACEQLGPVAKMNPPLRTAADIAGLKEGVADGTMTVLATDHAPHPASTKARPFGEASFGIVGLECALPLYVKALIDDGVIDWPRLIAMMTLEPARLLGGPFEDLGRLSQGCPADITVIDPELSWTIDSGEFVSRGRNCPFDGWTVRGRAIATIVNGRIRHGIEREIGR